MSSETQIRVAMRLTDQAGEPMVPLAAMAEPHSHSVVLIHGEWGTAFQKHTDGWWYSTTRGRNGLGRDWRWLTAQRNLVLVYDAPARPDLEEE